MGEWQPIETAPKDGTEIRAGRYSNIVALHGIPYPLKSKFIAGEWCAQFDCGVWRPYQPQPTHWQPLDVFDKREAAIKEVVEALGVMLPLVRLKYGNLDPEITAEIDKAEAALSTYRKETQ